MLARQTGTKRVSAASTADRSLRDQMMRINSVRLLHWATTLGVVGLVGTAPARAATITAASPSYTDVKTAVTNAAAGDTVVVPAGAATWGSTLALSKGLTLKGAGIDQTVITSSL